jgi:hypothetical protein
MPRKKKPDFEFPSEIQAIWHTAPNLTFCPKFRRARVDKVLEHIKQDQCERCLAVYRQLAKEADMILGLPLFCQHAYMIVRFGQVSVASTLGEKSSFVDQPEIPCHLLMPNRKLIYSTRNHPA